MMADDDDNDNVPDFKYETGYIYFDGASVYQDLTKIHLKWLQNREEFSFNDGTSLYLAGMHNRNTGKTNSSKNNPRGG